MTDREDEEIVEDEDNSDEYIPSTLSSTAAQKIAQIAVDAANMKAEIEEIATAKASNLNYLMGKTKRARMKGLKDKPCTIHSELHNFLEIYYKALIIDTNTTITEASY